MYDFIWDVYCDWYIEICKTRLNGDDAPGATPPARCWCMCWTSALKLLHPFMPFITEEIYQALPGSGETIMTAAVAGQTRSMTILAPRTALTLKS